MSLNGFEKSDSLYVFVGCLAHGTAALFGEEYATGEAPWQPCALATGSAKILACATVGQTESNMYNVSYHSCLIVPSIFIEP